VTDERRARVFAVLGMLLALNALVSTHDLGAEAYVVPPLVFACVALAGWRPVTAAGLLAVTTLLGGALGVTPESSAVLAAWLPLLYVVGRRSGLVPGIVSVAGAVAAMWILEPTIPNLAFGIVLFGGDWAFGRVVQSRARKARQAAAARAALAAEDQDTLVREVVASERARLTADAITLIAEAVDDMRRCASAARSEPAGTDLTAIGAHGAAAVAELRRMLGLLRTVQFPTAQTEPTEPPLRRWRVDLVTMLGIMVVTLTDPFLTGPWEFRPGGLVLCLPLVLRRTDPFLALAAGAALHAEHGLRRHRRTGPAVLDGRSRQPPKDVDRRHSVRRRGARPLVERGARKPADRGRVGRGIGVRRLGMA
jgi:hypothetical protein